MYQTCPGGYVGNLVVGRAISIQGYDGAYQSAQILLPYGSLLPIQEMCHFEVPELDKFTHPRLYGNIRG